MTTDMPDGRDERSSEEELCRRIRRLEYCSEDERDKQATGNKCSQTLMTGF